VTPEEIVTFSENLARIAASGGGPKALASHLAQTAGAGVLLEDAQWRHLAAAGTGPIPPSARGVVEAGAPGRAQRITAGTLALGWLSLFGSDTVPDAEILLRLAAAAIGVELARDGAGLRERKRGFWESLYDRAFHDAPAAREEAAARGITLASSYVTVALEAESAGETRTGDASELRSIAGETFRSTEGDVGMLERGLTLFVFVPASRTVDASNAKTAAGLLPKAAARRKAHARISGGVGVTAAAPDLRESADTAAAALAIGRRIFGSGRVAVYEELGAYRLLYEGADAKRLCAFATETLAPLRAYDEQHQTELERTLKLYFVVGQNVKTAAAQLNVHRHTVFYRLRQIGEICAKSLDSPHDQLTLRLAVAIDELHDAN
jgi:PucR family transcriptional regulator, purine catabolism regulatory protein